MGVMIVVDVVLAASVASVMLETVGDMKKT